MFALDENSYSQSTCKGMAVAMRESPLILKRSPLRKPAAHDERHCIMALPQQGVRLSQYAAAYLPEYTVVTQYD
jgi:hypothetical protein